MTTWNLSTNHDIPATSSPNSTLKVVALKAKYDAQGKLNALLVTSEEESNPLYDIKNISSGKGYRCTLELEERG